MFVTRPAKREKRQWLARDVLLDIMDGEKAIGQLSCDVRSKGSTITLGGRTLTVTRTRGAQDEFLYQAAARLLTGKPKPPPTRYDLADAAGQVLASAEQDGSAFAVSRGPARYRFAKGRSRPFELTREGDAVPLGKVGPRKFWTTQMHIDLPPSLDAAFQIFLLAVLMGLTLQRMEDASSSAS